VALAATLIYRAGSLWLPFALALAWQTAGSVRGSEDRSSAPAPHSDTPTSA
jgi:hypothetical protein